MSHTGIFLDMISQLQVLDAWGLAGVRTNRIGSCLGDLVMQYLSRTDAH